MQNGFGERQTWCDEMLSKHDEKEGEKEPNRANKKREEKAAEKETEEESPVCIKYYMCLSTEKHPVRGRESQLRLKGLESTCVHACMQI